MKDVDLSRVEEGRREVEARLAQVRGALTSELGRAPRGRGWIVALLAAAAGVAVARKLRGARSGSRKRRLGDHRRVAS